MIGNKLTIIFIFTFEDKIKLWKILTSIYMYKETLEKRVKTADHIKFDKRRMKDAAQSRN